MLQVPSVLDTTLATKISKTKTITIPIKDKISFDSNEPLIEDDKIPITSKIPEIKANTPKKTIELVEKDIPFGQRRGKSTWKLIIYEKARM